jgi:hypothetical protein
VMSSRRLMGCVLSRGQHPTKVHRIASHQIAASDVRFGSKADIGSAPVDVRFTPESGHERQLECPLWTNSGREQVQQTTCAKCALFDHLVGTSNH